MNSAGFNKRRDREAKLELGMDRKRDRDVSNAERPLDQQISPDAGSSGKNRSLLGRLWQALRGK